MIKNENTAGRFPLQKVAGLDLTAYKMVKATIGDNQKVEPITATTDKVIGLVTSAVKQGGAVAVHRTGNFSVVTPSALIMGNYAKIDATGALVDDGATITTASIAKVNAVNSATEAIIDLINI